MKRILSIVLSIIVLLGVFSVITYADNTPVGYKEFVFNAVYNMESNINLKKYNVKLDDVNNYLDFLYQQYPEFYYLHGINGGSQTTDGKVITLNIAYDRSLEQMLEERKFMEEETDKVINKIDDGWTQTQKALYVHDWLVVNYMYDYRLFEGLGSENHDILGFLRDKIGVCQSYAYTYMYILHRLGMNAYYVISDTDCHAWNVVEIDGKWYHVDTTYDDPILGHEYRYDYVGEVDHSKFLLSDSEIIADGYHDDFSIPKVEGIVCEKYSGNDFFKTATTSVYNIGEYWYYIDNSKNAGGLMRTKDFKNTERIKEIGYFYSGYNAYGWVRQDGAIYNRYFAGLYEYNGHLFFNDEENIYVYDTHHDELKTLPIDRPNGKIYYGLNMDGKDITYLASENSLWDGVIEGTYTLGVEILHLYTEWEVIKQPTQTEDGEKVKYCYFCGEIVERQSIPSLSAVVFGDANGDGKVDTTDLASLKLFLANIDKNIDAGGDLNSDGKVDTVDLAELKLKLAGIK